MPKCDCWQFDYFIIQVKKKYMANFVAQIQTMYSVPAFVTSILVLITYMMSETYFWTDSAKKTDRLVSLLLTDNTVEADFFSPWEWTMNVLIRGPSTLHVCMIIFIDVYLNSEDVIFKVCFYFWFT